MTQALAWARSYSNTDCTHGDKAWGEVSAILCAILYTRANSRNTMRCICIMYYTYVIYIIYNIIYIIYIIFFSFNIKITKEMDLNRCWWEYILVGPFVGLGYGENLWLHLSKCLLQEPCISNSPSRGLSLCTKYSCPTQDCRQKKLCCNVVLVKNWKQPKCP